MNISKHTPKPWQFVTEGRERKIIADGQEIMCDMHYYPWCPYNDADWRLIAAAPDLLEALILAWPIIEHERFKQDGSYGSSFVQHKADRARQAHAKARSAIAKANGEQV